MKISLRKDQAECALGALRYCIARFDNQSAVTDQQPAIRFACRLAKERAAEVAAIFERAINGPPAV